MTILAELHRGHHAQLAHPETGQLLEVLVLDDPADCGQGRCSLSVQPENARRAIRLTAREDLEVVLLPSPRTVWWVSVEDAAVRLHVPARKVLELVVSGRLAARLVVDHYEVSTTALDRFRRVSAGECSSPAAGSVAPSVGGAQ